MERADGGILIAIEGIDGAGKTTQVDLLSRFLISAGERISCSKEPTDGPWGQKIRKSAANGRMNAADELTAFIEDRKEHLRDKILPALAEGKTVILDRYCYSTIAYQGSRIGDIEAVANRVLENAIKPDVVLILDVPPEIGLARIREGRDETPNAFETMNNLKMVRQAFRSMVDGFPNITIIDGTPSIKFVQKTVLTSLLDGILYKKHCAKHWGCGDPFNCMYRMTGECRWATMKGLASQLVP